jgi:1-aminocyclopropane-1-carboxylate deaminase
VSLDDFPRVSLLFGLSPVHPLPRLSAALGGRVEIWAKREDCNSGIAFGGNKVRKLEYLVADALATGCDTLVSIGGVQSNHTRAVTGVARHLGLGAVTVQEHWVDWDDPRLTSLRTTSNRRPGASGVTTRSGRAPAGQSPRGRRSM